MGYPNQWPPQYPYQQPYGYPPPTSRLAVASLILGLAAMLLSWITCGLLSAGACGFGHQALKEIRAGTRTGRGMAIVGIMLGYISWIPALIFGVWVLTRQTQ